MSWGGPNSASFEREFVKVDDMAYDFALLVLKAAELPVVEEDGRLAGSVLREDALRVA